MPRAGRTRADVALVERGLAPSRARAQALVLAGRVYVGEARVEKPSVEIDEGAPLRVREGERFVSRGGLKLEGALAELGLVVTGLTAVDVGASTGGFSDCLLQRGAAKVYCVDVGHGQLAPALRSDARVVVMERTNARHLDARSFAEPIELVVVDASFIGVDKLLPAIATFCPSGARLLAMIKPQFEVGRVEAKKARGVIRDPALRQQAIDAAKRAIVEHGFVVDAECDSRLAGPKGNVERFVLATRG